MSRNPLEAALHLTRSAQGRWRLHSTRAEWAGPMLRGRPAEHAPTLLPGLYALCGGAHRLAARHALAAARGTAAAPTRDAAAQADAQALRLDTLREHLRRLWLDAPRWAGVDEGVDGTSIAIPPAAELAGAAFMHPGARLDDAATERATRRWVEAQVLQGDANAWVAGWSVGPASHARDWIRGSTTWPARWLEAVHRRLGEQATPCRALRAAGTAAGLQSLADALRSQPSFALQPTEDGEPAETGCWTRIADAGRAQGAASGAVAWPFWLRHAARIAEVARLVTDEGAGCLAQGRFSPALVSPAPVSLVFGATTQNAHPAASPAADRAGLREGLGWCEMARGLLVHWVCLDADDRIADYRVLAPTEWNFHPAGAAAWALLAAVEGTGPATGGRTASEPDAGHVRTGVVDMAQILAIAAAYDPCVELRLEPRMPEPADA